MGASAMVITAYKLAIMPTCAMYLVERFKGSTFKIQDSKPKILCISE